MASMTGRVNCVASSFVSEWTTVGDEPSFLAVKIAALLVSSVTRGQAVATCAAGRMVSLQCGQTTVASMCTMLANRKVNKRIVGGNGAKRRNEAAAVREAIITNGFSAGSPAKRSGAADCLCT